jgi:predicted enzyme related to lactoylglutathione lyase
MLCVKDLKRMEQFYSDLLRVAPANQNWVDVWAVFNTGGVQFALHMIPSDVAKNIEIASPPVPRESEPVKLVFEVEDVEQERERLESLGIQTMRRAWQKNGEACDAVDPEDNVFQLCSSVVDALS